MPRGRRVLNEGQAPNGEAAEDSDDEGADVTGEDEDGELEEQTAEALGDGSERQTEVEAGEGEADSENEELDEQEEDLDEEEKGVEGDRETSERSGELEEGESSLEEDGAERAETNGEETESGDKGSALDDLLDHALAMGGTKSRKTEGTRPEAQGEASKVVIKTGKRYLSKAERKKMKKGQVGDSETGEADGTDGADGMGTEREALEEAGGSSLVEPSADAVASAKALLEAHSMKKEEASQKLSGKIGSGPTSQSKGREKDSEQGRGQKPGVTSGAKEELTRGKRAKLKKAKDKYAEQDEEERELRMALLASAGKGDKAAGKGGKKGGKGARGKADEPVKANRESTGAVQNEQKVCYKCKQAGHVAKDCPFDAKVSGAAVSGEAKSGTTEVEGTEAAEGAQSENAGDATAGVAEAPTAEKRGDGKEGDVANLSRRARARAQNEGERAEIAAILEEENLQVSRRIMLC